MSALIAKPLTPEPLTAQTLIARALGAGEVVSDVYSPTSLFASNEEGAFFDFSNLATLRQNSDGTGAVVDWGDPVGFVADQSKGATDFAAAFSDSIVTPASGFTSGYPSYIDEQGLQAERAIVDGAARIVLDGDGVSNHLRVFFTAEAGKRYRVTMDCDSNAGFNPVAFSGLVETLPFSYSSGPKSLVFDVVATTTDVFMRFYPRSSSAVPASQLNGDWFEISSITIQEWIGNHLTQPTSTARPLLARVPVGGRRNLVNKSNDFSAGYTESNLTESAGVLSENGTSSTKTFTAISEPHQIQVDGSSQYALSIEIKPEGRSWVAIQARGSGMPTGGSCYFNLATGTLGTLLADTDSAAIVDAGDGYYRCTVVVTSDAVGDLEFRIYSSDGDGDVSTVGISAPAYSIRNLQIEKASAATAYQQVTAAYDITESGKADVVGLLFDGVDDYLVSPSIDLTGTDAASVGVAGSSFMSGTAFLLEQNQSTPRLTVTARQDTTPDTVSFTAGGSTARIASMEVGSAALPFSMVGRADISGDIIKASGSGVADDTAADMGTGNFADEIVVVGARTNFSNDSQIFMSSALLIDRFITDEETTELETYLEEKAGVE
jgi:hypothetical protein